MRPPRRQAPEERQVCAEASALATHLIVWVNQPDHQLALRAGRTLCYPVPAAQRPLVVRHLMRAMRRHPQGVTARYDEAAGTIELQLDQPARHPRREYSMICRTCQDMHWQSQGDADLDCFSCGQPGIIQPEFFTSQAHGNLSDAIFDLKVKTTAAKA